MSDPHTDAGTDGGAAPGVAARQKWMAILARADAKALTQRLSAWGAVPPYTRLRGPEAGLWADIKTGTLFDPVTGNCLTGDGRLELRDAL